MRGVIVGKFWGISEIIIMTSQATYKLWMIIVRALWSIPGVMTFKAFLIFSNVGMDAGMQLDGRPMHPQIVTVRASSKKHTCQKST
jgi:hypothetical protein